MKFFEEVKNDSHNYIMPSNNLFFDDVKQPKHKKCSCCKSVKEYSQFFNDSSTSSGKRSFCKKCYMRYESLPHRVARNRASQRVISALKSQNLKKQHKTMDLVGCTPNELRTYLENLFIEGMTWENHGEVWHIDHIRPCASFNLEDERELYTCFNYTNLQPLFVKDNLSKNNKVGFAEIKKFKMANPELGMIENDNRGITKREMFGISNEISERSSSFLSWD